MLLGLFLLVLVILLIIPFSLEIRYHRSQSDDDFKVIFWIWKIPLHIHVSYIKRLGSKWITQINVGSSGVNKKFNSVFSLAFLNKMKHTPVPRILRILLRVSTFILKEIEQLEIKLTFSTGEASFTGFVAGLAWNLMAAGLVVVNQRIVLLNRPLIQIIPHFGPRMFEVSLNCIFKIQLGHIILENIKRQLNLGKGG